MAFEFRLNIHQAMDGLWSVAVLCNSDKLHTHSCFADKRQAEIFGEAFIAGIEYIRGSK